MNLAALDRTNAVHIDTVRSDLVNPYLPDVGSVSPLLRSAIGRALLLAHTANERSRLLNQLKIYDAAQYAECLEFLAPDEALFRAKGYFAVREGPGFPTLMPLQYRCPDAGAGGAGAAGIVWAGHAVFRH